MVLEAIIIRLGEPAAWSDASLEYARSCRICVPRITPGNRQWIGDCREVLQDHTGSDEVAARCRP